MAEMPRRIVMAKIKRIEKFEEGCVLPITNRPVKWASLITPDTKFDPCWKIDIVLTKEQADKMKSAGFKVRQDTDGDWILRAKKKVRTKSGQPMSAPTVVGRDGVTPFTENVGNGSICNVNIFAKYIEVSGQTYLPAYLNEVQVVEHVPYGGGSGFANVDEDGDAASGDLDF
jgi:hypothetical protein